MTTLQYLVLLELVLAFFAVLLAGGVLGALAERAAGPGSSPRLRPRPRPIRLVWIVVGALATVGLLKFIAVVHGVLWALHDYGWQ